MERSDVLKQLDLAFDAATRAATWAYGVPRGLPDPREAFRLGFLFALIDWPGGAPWLAAPAAAGVQLGGRCACGHGADCLKRPGAAPAGV